MTALPHAPSSALREMPRRQRMLGPAFMIGGLTVATVALHLRDPHEQGSWGVCPSYALWGIYCPGCGGLRAVNNLTNLDLVGAASSNLLFIAVLPVILWVLGRWTVRRWRGEPYLPRFLATERFAVVLVVVLVGFMVVRNIPAFGWLAP